MFRRRRKPPSDVMATTHIASMLDELMGRNRNDINAKELSWTDADVCKYFVVEFCPNDLFTNTKADLGPCGKIHDENLKRMYQEDTDNYKKSLYQDDFLKFCQRMLSELQSKIKRAKERLLLTQQNEERMLNAGGTGVTGGQDVEADEKIVLLSEKIAALVEEAERAGTNGNVEEAQELLRLCDELKDERERLRRSVMPNSSFKEEYAVHQKAMEVCETCGAFLIVGDAQQRIDDHLLGKQHMGYSRLRNAIDKLMNERKKQREEREKEAEERRIKREEEDRKKEDKRRKSRSRSRDRKPRKSRERSAGRSRDRKKRSRSRDKKHRSRSRSRNRKRSRSRERRRSRSREKRRRSRTRSRERRQRSKSRSRDRGRKRSRSRSRKRSRSRERSRRSRSRSKDRSRKSRSKSRERSRKSRSRSHESGNRENSEDRNVNSRSGSPRSSSSPRNNGDRSP